MDKGKISISVESLMNFFKLLLARAPRPENVGTPCLTSDEFIGYDMGTLSDGELERVEGHLGECEICGERMDEFLIACEEWRTPKGKARLDALRRELLGPLADQLKNEGE